jgi:hypothetical protein
MGPFGPITIPFGISGRTSFPFPGIHPIRDGLGLADQAGLAIHTPFCPVLWPKYTI